MRYLWYFFLAQGLLMLGIAIAEGWGTTQFSLTAARAQGTVINNRYTTDGDGHGNYHPEVEFVGTDKLKHSFISKTGSSPATFAVGERVPVLYDSDQPENATINQFSERFFTTVILSVLGLVFSLAGVIPLLLGVRNSREAEWLKLNGQAIQADYTGTRKNTSYEVNGRNPYRISAQWLNPATNEVRVFMSPNLWFDPAPHITSKTITVLIDPRNPKRYWMDTSFLPKLAK